MSATRNVYKVRAFATAIKAISQLDRPIRTAAEAKSVSHPSSCLGDDLPHDWACRQLKGVGVGIAKRIEAFLSGSEYVRGCLLCPRVDFLVLTRVPAPRLDTVRCSSTPRSRPTAFGSFFSFATGAWNWVRGGDSHRDTRN
jgi:hypothetical protein